MMAFARAVIIAFICLCAYGEGYRIWHARRVRSVRLPDRIYDPLYAWVIDAEERGTISPREAEEAFAALIEAESLEWLLVQPAATDGPREGA